MREIRPSGSEGGAGGQSLVPTPIVSCGRSAAAHLKSPEAVDKAREAGGSSIAPGFSRGYP